MGWPWVHIHYCLACLTLLLLIDSEKSKAATIPEKARNKNAAYNQGGASAALLANPSTLSLPAPPHPFSGVLNIVQFLLLLI
jgi:hypothetical protein